MRTLLSTAQNLSLGAGFILLVSCGATSPTSGDPIVVASGGAATAALGGNGNLVNGGAPANGGAAQGNGGAAQGNGGAAQGNGGAAQGNGGVTATGGSQNKGGSTGTGGASTSSAGGSTGTSACVDTPRSSESCADAKTWGFCSQTWFAGYCKATCGTCGTSTGNGGATSAGGATSTATTGGRATGGATTTTAATGGATTTATGGVTGSGASVTPLTNGSSGITTRYWDCCMPSCSWKENATADGKSSPSTVCAKDGATVVAQSAGSACSGGSGYQCNWGAPWQAGTNLAYGYAAHNGGNCGKCYQLDFTGAGDNAGAQALKGKSMVVQVVNTGGIAANQFDLLIPGGGVGANNACTGSGKMWGDVPGGATYGGFLATCGTNTSCVTSMCTAAFGGNSALMGGCNWFVGWFNAANNPAVKYAEVPCPAEITSKSGLK